MTEEAGRTRSQKRGLEHDPVEDDADGKRMRTERGLPADDPRPAPDPQAIPEPPELASGNGADGPAEDGPVDMRTSHSDTRAERRAPSPDVIVLSDGEQPASPKVNGLGQDTLEEPGTEALMKSSPEDRERVIKQLKEELRLEEAKLVLLKKLRQSQIQKEAPTQKPSGSTVGAVTTPPPLVRGTQNIPPSKVSLQTSSTRVPGSVIPPPLVRGGQQVSSKLGSTTSSQVVMPPLVRGAQQIIRQHSGTGPPPLLLAPRASVPSVQIQGQRIIQQGLIRVANVPSASLLVNIPQQPSPASTKGTSGVAGQPGSTPASVASATSTAESPASRQAAAKLALRKQLEKTLLEIPPPKPPAPEMSFLPSAANNEFIYLVGLEEVVQNLLETQAGRVAPKAVLTSREPHACAQCHTDFTCRWREEKGGAVMCENCTASRQKRALKAEHTSRLKAAFVKALQQEQEIEQRLLQAGPPQAQPKAEPATAHPALKQVIKPRRKLAFRSGEARDWSNGAVLQASSQLARSSASTRGVLHSFSPSPKLQASASTGTLVSRTGRHAERPAGAKGGAASSWKKASLSSGGALAFVSPSLAVHKTSAAADRQREYLLDMIPPRSIPQSAAWK